MSSKSSASFISLHFKRPCIATLKLQPHRSAYYPHGERAQLPLFLTKNDRWVLFSIFSFSWMIDSSSWLNTSSKNADGIRCCIGSFPINPEWVSSWLLDCFAWRSEFSKRVRPFRRDLRCKSWASWEIPIFSHSYESFALKSRTNSRDLRVTIRPLSRDVSATSIESMSFCCSLIRFLQSNASRKQTLFR